MKILIAYDGSNCANDALNELKRAGMPEEAEVLILTVAEPWHVPVGPAGTGGDVSSLSNKESALRTATEGRATLRQYFPDWKIEAEGVKGSPSEEIIRRGNEWGADLIVLGSHGLNAMERFVFGSVSQQVLTGAHCSVRVGRGNPHHDYEPTRLLIGIDGSIDSEKAVDTVLSRNWPEQTKVWLVTGVASYFEETESEEERKSYEDLHDKIEVRMKEKGLSTASIIDAVDPKYLILSTAKEVESDSIFMGSRGLTRFERTILGSISASVTARANCSVEVIRTATVEEGIG